MKRSRNVAIVFGGGTTTGLGAIRSLGRAGVEVWYMGEDKEIAVYSKYCKRYFIFPKISYNKGKLRRVLSELQRQLAGVAVLFPASDSYALSLSDIIDELSGYYLPAPKKEVTEIMINKKKLYQSLIKEKISHPTTYFPRNLEDVRKISRQVSYPVFIKPSISHSFAKRFRKKGFTASSGKKLLSYWALMKKVGIDVVIQEIVPGPATNHVFLDGYFDRHSNPKALFARRRLRMWPLAFGNSSLCLSIPVSEIIHLKNRLFRYLRSVNYYGIFSAEFKKDSRDGVFKLLEINSRTSAWFNTLSAKCGINLMLVAYLDAIGKDTQYSEDYEAGVKWIFLTADLKASVKLFVNGNLTIQEWISSLLGKRDYLSYANDDLRPFVMGLPRTIFQMMHMHA